MEVIVSPEHEVDGSCELWPWLYRSRVEYRYGEASYPIAAMYADVYAYENAAYCPSPAQPSLAPRPGAWAWRTASPRPPGQAPDQECSRMRARVA